MKKRSLLLATIMLLSVVLVACGQANNGAANNGNNGEAAADGGEDLTIGFVTDEGGINDQSFNQSVWEGLQEAEKDFGVKVEYQESNEANDYVPNIETLIDNGNQLVVGAGFNLGDHMEEMANANPDVNFAIVDYGYEDAPDNLAGLVFKQEEPSFLVGYIAAHTTESNKVGFVGGQESTVISAFEYGYKAGVAYGAKELGKDIEVVSQYVGNFSDAAKGKSIATNMYQQGADIVFHASGGAGDGVIEAAKDQDKWAIGVDRDQYEQAPDNVLTSAMKLVGKAVYDVVDKMNQGEEFPGGQTLVYGLAEEAVGIAPTSDKNVKPEVLELIDPLIQKIVDEEIVVPTNAEEYDAFIAE